MPSSDITAVTDLQGIGGLINRVAPQPPPRSPTRRRAAVHRRITPASLNADRMAESFAGLPDGVTGHGQLLAAFKAAAPRLGIPRRVVDAADSLFKQTRPQDWDRRSRPIVWPSSAMQREALGLSPTRDKALTRELGDLGLVVMKDSPTGKRYGKRDGRGRIVEAYGFDLSLFAVRYAEFVRVAAEAKAEREETARLRRRATVARKAIRQVCETAVEYGFQGDEWRTAAEASRALTKALGKIERPDDMAFDVASLEQLHVSVRERLENLLAEVAGNAPESVIPDPVGAENGPHESTYNLTSKPEEATVIAREQSSGGGGEASDPRSAPVRREPPEKVFKLRADELVKLAPRLSPYLRSPDASLPEIVEAANWLRSELKVSRSLWAEACLVMGREQAAVAIAIVSTKAPAHFRTTAAGYFYGMVTKAKSGHLHLDRTIWGMRHGRPH